MRAAMAFARIVVVQASVSGAKWPHRRMNPAREAGMLLDHLCRWIPEAALRGRTLVDNPALLSWQWGGTNRTEKPRSVLTFPRLTGCRLPLINGLPSSCANR